MAGCVLDEFEDPSTATVEQELTTANRLASNRLASNRLASNRLASNSLGAAALTSGGLIETVEGRDVFSYIVSCALPGGKSVTVKDSRGTSYTFGGEIGLAPRWQTATPTVSERRWVTACVLARTNYYGVPVQLSMRGTATVLRTTASEKTTFSVHEGAFYGDLFDTTQQTWFSCGTRTWTPADAELAQRTCTISQDGVTTMCGFAYTGLCLRDACTGVPQSFTCNGGGTAYAEVIATYLPPT